MIEAIIYSVVALSSGMKKPIPEKIDCKARQSTICMTWDSANVNPGKMAMMRRWAPRATIIKREVLIGKYPIQKSMGNLDGQTKDAGRSQK
jgi:hypothetical protein